MTDGRQTLRHQVWRLSKSCCRLKYLLKNILLDDQKLQKCFRNTFISLLLMSSSKLWTNKLQYLSTGRRVVTERSEGRSLSSSALCGPLWTSETSLKVCSGWLVSLVNSSDTNLLQRELVETNVANVKRPLGQTCWLAEVTFGTVSAIAESYITQVRVFIFEYHFRS